MSSVPQPHPTNLRAEGSHVLDTPIPQTPMCSDTHKRGNSSIYHIVNLVIGEEQDVLLMTTMGRIFTGNTLRNPDPHSDKGGINK